MKWFNKSLKRLPITKFDIHSSQSIELKLNSIKPSRTEALFLDIPGNAVSLTMCEDIVLQIQNFKKENKHIPIYSFAGDFLTGPTLLVLLSADYSYIDKSTMMGMFDFTSRRTVLYKYLESKNYQIRLNKHGKHKIRLDPFEPIKEEDKQWAIDLLKKDNKYFLDRVCKLRGNRLKIQDKELENYINSGFISPEDAVKIGLFDGIHSLDALRLEKYPKLKITDLKPSIMDTLRALKKMKAEDLSGIYTKDIDSLDINSFIDECNQEAIQYIADNSLKYNNLI